MGCVKQSLSLRWGVQAAVATGGLAALSWEVVWQLQTSLSLGVSALGTALTLATTMAGMTAGSLVVGQRLRRREAAAPLRLYGLLELAIGLAGLALPVGFALLEAHGLSFDLQTPYWHLAEAYELACDFPRTRIILNHTGLPADRSDSGLADWRRAMEVLARAPNAVVKMRVRRAVGGGGLPPSCVPPARASVNVPSEVSCTSRSAGA